MSAPTLPAGHDDYAALAVAWVLGALEPADRDRFHEHCASCPDCVAEVAAALRVAVELAYGVPDREPPPDLRGRVLGAARERPALPRPP